MVGCPLWITCDERENKNLLKVMCDGGTIVQYIAPLDLLIDNCRDFCWRGREGGGKTRFDKRSIFQI
jgi:hypothetical protein